MKTMPKRLVGCDLIGLAAQNPETFVALCEKNYQERVERLARAILDSGCHIVMLTGPSATGKTTSSHKLAREIRRQQRKSTVLSLDDFFIGEGKYPKRNDGTDDYECVEALDLPELRRCLKELDAAGCCEAPVFDFVTQLPSGTQYVDCRGGVVIVEGLHALNPILTEHLERGKVFNVYASLREEYTGSDGARCVATRDIRLARRMIRDYRTRGHAPGETLDMWPHVCEGEKRYIQVFQNRADAILDTTHSYEVCLWARQLAAIRNDLDYTDPDTPLFVALCEKMSHFPPLPDSLVPADSMLREFITPEQ